MPLSDIVLGNLRRSVELYRELIAGVHEENLIQSLPGLPSNTIGQQLWCIVGARESYTRALQAGKWSGFQCTLDAEGIKSVSSVAQALARSGRELLATGEQLTSFTDAQHQLLMDVLEHEAAHQGQLIRYLYALRLSIPRGWKERYALD